MDPVIASILMDLVELLNDINDAKIDDDFLTTPRPCVLIHDRIEIVRGRVGDYIKRGPSDQADGSGG